MIDNSRIPDTRQQAQVLFSLGSVIAGRVIGMVGSVAAATEAAAQMMRVEDGAMFCTDVDDMSRCCSYWCYIDYETSL